MMRQMRENTKWIMLITAFAFVGLMVFQWGMDITGSSGLSVGEIGSVNGVPVSYEEYNFTYSRLMDQIQNSQEEPITSQQISDIEDAAWDEVVNQVLIRQELQRRGIEVTDDEVRSAARFSPPAELRSSPAFQTDGVFDIQKYQAFLASPTIDDQVLLQLEAYYRENHPARQAAASGVFGRIHHGRRALAGLQGPQREDLDPIRSAQSDATNRRCRRVRDRRRPSRPTTTSTGPSSRFWLRPRSRRLSS